MFLSRDAFDDVEDDEITFSSTTAPAPPASGFTAPAPHAPPPNAPKASNQAGSPRHVRSTASIDAYNANANNIKQHVGTRPTPTPANAPYSSAGAGAGFGGAGGVG